MRRFVGAAIGAGFVVASALLASPAEAQEIQLTGPLKGAPAVRHLRLYREGRFEIAPTVSATLLDEYRRTFFFGARLQYNVKEWLGLGVWGAYGALSLTTDLTEQIDKAAPRNDQTSANVAGTTAEAGSGKFGDQTSKLQWVAAPQVQFTPFRGKLAIFQKIFVDTDAYLHAGVAIVGVQERKACTGAACNRSTAGAFDLDSRVAIAPTFGLGLTFYASNLVSLGLEYRAVPFAWNRAGFDSRGSGNDGRFPDGKVDGQDSTFRFNQMITLGVGLFPQKRASSE